MRFTAPKFLKRLYPDSVWTIDNSDKVYLTFDDGPTPGITEYILSVLDKYDAKATFFCLGKNADMYPDLHRQIIDAGHKVGNHSYSHIKGWEVKTEQYVEDVDLANQFLSSDLFRPPYGRITPRQGRILAERYRLVMWDIISQDYSQWVSPRQCVENVTRYLRGGSIVVFHDSVKAYKNMHYALPKVLDFMQEHNLKTSTIELWSKQGAF